MYVKDTTLNRQLSDHSSPFDHFCTLQDFLFFSLSFQFVPNSLFKKEKLVKSDCLNVFENNENFILNRCVIKYYAISNGHIGDGHREIQESDTHLRVLQALGKASGLGMNEWVLIATCKQLVWSSRIGRNMPIWILCLRIRPPVRLYRWRWRGVWWGILF